MRGWSGLWRHPAFIKLWAAETISVFGSTIGGLALPLLAAEQLNATPAQMGLLNATATLPWLLIGLFAGVWVDRLRRRPLLIAADVGRALALSLIPLLWWQARLRIEALYLIGLTVGVLTVFFDIAYQSYLPALVGREQIVEGNSKLEVSRSAAQIAGPGLGGALVQWIGAPLTILVDALSFALSGLLLAWIRSVEPAPPRAAHERIWRAIGTGLRLIAGHPYLRPLAGYVATFNLCASVANALSVLFLTRELRLEPAALGLILTIGAPGALVGALLAGRITQRYGLGRTLIAMALLGGIGMACAPLAAGPAPLISTLLIGGQFITGLSVVIYNINAISLRQIITPHHLLGRMNASMRFLIWGTMPIGALLGGLLGEAIGLRPALLIAAGGCLAAAGWLVFSPLRELREPPPAPAPDAGLAHAQP